MTPLELKQHTAIAVEAKLANPDIDDPSQAELTLDNYLDDLADLARAINEYLSRCECADPEGQAELDQRLQSITTKVKNTAVIYTDCIKEAFDSVRQLA